jgi:hypothetical protein
MLRRITKALTNVAKTNRELIAQDSKIALLELHKQRLSDELRELREQDNPARTQLLRELTLRDYTIDGEPTDFELVEALSSLLKHSEDRSDVDRDRVDLVSESLDRARLDVIQAQHKTTMFSDWQFRILGLAGELPEFSTAANRPLAALLGAIHTGPKQ